jgi:hypothetical protein
MVHRTHGNFEKGDVMVDKEQNETSLENDIIKKQSFCQNLDVPDQSGCFSAEMKLVKLSFDFIKENTNVCVREDFLVNNNKILFQNSAINLIA